MAARIDDIVTLREYLELKIEQLEKLVQSNEIVHLREFEAFQALYRSAHKSLADRVEAVDNARDAMDKERSLYVSRDFLDARLANMLTRLSDIERARANMEGRFWMLGAGLTALSVIVNLFLHYAVSK